MYALPTFYNYGIGSAGFGAFRELVAHIKTTNWVLEGLIENFPLMYHYRILPFCGQHRELDEEYHRGYIKYWGSNRNIDTYIRDRNRAKYQIILFLEHIPYVLRPWLMQNQDKVQGIVREMQNTIGFLRQQGMIHFDAHFDNILIDGEIPYLTDFGLVLDKNFALDKAEKAFFRRHTNYDHAEFLFGLGAHIHRVYDLLPETKRQKILSRYAAKSATSPDSPMSILLPNLEEIHRKKLMKLHEHYVEEILKHRALIDVMQTFYSQMRQRDHKDAKYPAQRLKRLLEAESVQ